MGEGMSYALARRNEPQWRAIAAFLSLQRTAHAAARSGSAAARREAVRSIPDGNHGDNRRSIE
jgi:hypothetical protein